MLDRRLPLMFNFFSCRWRGMLMRSCLAAIDFNENVDRPAKTSEEGDVCFREKVSESNA